MRLTAKQITWLKVCLHLAGFLPLLWLFWAINHGGLSADPVKDIQHFTGRTALKFLLATLLVSPLARYAKQPLLIRTRRLLGLWCFIWATLHLTSYALLELGIHNLALLGSELISRPYLTLGIISWLVLLALTLTSTQFAQRMTLTSTQFAQDHTGAQRKLGKRWQTLHNVVYLVAILAPIHYLWSVKILSPQPVIYAALALALLALRYRKFRQWWR
ncbi:putative membrane protein [Salmonella enterica subsp. enterica serovar Uganda str. R8-3404]|uniref:Protein-methionine-sulfoxide reductase heme-binding subunit MsrQ n=3 Tax=Salmonella enterica I TaxID=59201 RepID=A0A6C8GXV8_SALET|nr:putative membrane protein [Salmonella enterica subsp. enterica serovar Uganda str. R8-3404]